MEMLRKWVPKPGMEADRVIVVGAGAGGMMAAGRAAEMGAEVLLLEKTDGPGKEDSRQREEPLQPDERPRSR